MKRFSVGVAAFKVLTAVQDLLWTAWNRVVLSLIWQIGPSVRFRGRVQVRSAAGQVTVRARVDFGPMVNIEASRGAVLVIGENVSVNQGTFIVARERIEIGAYTRIGEYVSIRDNDHAFDDPTVRVVNQGYRTAAVRVGSDVWIGRGAVILKGVTIGDGAVIGAGAVVTKNVPPQGIAVGVPARVIRRRGETA